MCLSDLPQGVSGTQVTPICVHCFCVHDLVSFNSIRHASSGTWQRFFVISLTLKIIFHISLLKLKNQYFHICSIHSWMSQRSKFSWQAPPHKGTCWLCWEIWVTMIWNQLKDIAGLEWTRNPHVYHAGWIVCGQKTTSSLYSCPIANYGSRICTNHPHAPTYLLATKRLTQQHELWNKKSHCCDGVQ
jgi:hypothetical protein